MYFPKIALPFLLALGIVGVLFYTKRHNLIAQEFPHAIPIEVLFGNAEQKLNPRVSPDGSLIAYRAPLNKVTNLWVRSIDGSIDRPVTKDTGRGIQGYFWAYDNKHLLYVQDIDGDENWQLYKVNLEDGTTTNLTPIKGIQAMVISYQKEFPNRILVGINERDPKNHDAYELNLQTGQLTLLEENPGLVVDWTADHTLQIRAIKKNFPDGSSQLLVRDTLKDPWRVIATWTLEEGELAHIYQFTADNKSLYLTDPRNVNTASFVQMSCKDGSVEKVIASDPEYDISSATLIFNQSTYIPEAIGYERERRVWKALMPELERDLTLMQSLDEGDMIVSSRSSDDRYWLLGFSKDTGPVAYWIFDRTSGRGSFLFDHQPQLKKYALASMSPIRYQSRDGLTIHGYLTCPSEGECKNVPLILLVHGGPWARDQWGYHSEVQFLASRGYAVLQVNFRGSTGYGKKFLNAGNKEWGRAMHNDLLDAINWAIDQGIADPQRIAIFGGSYGGYAALAGAAFSPEVFKCAVDIVGPSNIITLIKSLPPYWEAYKAIFSERVGNIETEEEFLKECSPLFHVDKIKAPILIAQGKNDPRVKQAESEQIVKALKEKGLPHEYMLFEDEGHGFVKPENRIKFYKKAEEFLAKYL